jgi:signal peptidase II
VRKYLILGLSFFVTVLDQGVKHLVRSGMEPGASFVVVPRFFNISYVQNTGAAWGIFQGFTPALVLFTFLLLVVMIRYRRHLLTDSLISYVAMALLIGGSVGNLIDRIRLNYVVDYLDFNFGGWSFPAFNIADSAICIGVGLYMLSQIMAEKAAQAKS